MRWKVTCLSTFDDVIVVGGLKESTSFYRYIPRSAEFQFLGSDIMSRNITHCLALSKNFSVSSDDNGNIFGLANEIEQENLAVEKNLVKKFFFNTGEPCMKIQKSVIRTPLPYINIPNLASEDIIGSWDEGQKNVLYVNSSGGSIFGVLNISYDVFEILKGLELELTLLNKCKPVLGN